jgi:hypothetical protein
LIDYVFLLFFYFGLTSLDPPPENGMANFGTAEFSLEYNLLKQYNPSQPTAAKTIF